MNNDGLKLIKKTIADLEAKRVQLPPAHPAQPDTTDQLTLRLAGVPQESPAEIAKLQSALVYLNPDTYRGHGSFFEKMGILNLISGWRVFGE